MLSQFARRVIPLSQHFVPGAQVIKRSAYQVPGNSNNYDTVLAFPSIFNSIEGDDFDYGIERVKSLQVIDYEGGLCIADYFTCNHFVAT